MIDHKPRSTTRNGLLSGLRQLNGAVVISIRGEVDLANASSLRAYLKTATETGKKLVVVDLKDLQYIDLSGINALLNASRAFAHDGYSIVLAAVPPMVQRILRIVGLGQAIPVFLTVETALHGKTNTGGSQKATPAP